MAPMVVARAQKMHGARRSLAHNEWPWPKQLGVVLSVNFL